MNDTSNEKTKPSDHSSIDKYHETNLKSEASCEKQVQPEESRSFKEDFERKMRVLGQLKIAKRLRAVFEQAAEEADKATPDEAKKILLEQSKNINELVSLTEALRGSYTLDSYRFYDSIAILNEKKQEKVMHKSHDIISSHVCELMKERESSLAINGSQLLFNEDNFDEGEINKSNKDSLVLELKSNASGNHVETNKESIDPPPIVKRKRRKSKKNLMDLDDDIFDDSQYLDEYSDQHSKFSTGSSSKKRKKKSRVDLSDEYVDDLTIDSMKVKVSARQARKEKKAKKSNYNNDVTQSSNSSSNKKHKVSAVLSNPDHIEGSNGHALKVKVAVSGKTSPDKKFLDPLTKGSASCQNIVGSGNDELIDSFGEFITVKVCISGEETMSLIGIMKKNDKKDFKSAEKSQSSSISTANSKIERKNLLQSSISSNDIDSSATCNADNVQSDNIDKSNIKETASTRPSRASTAAKKLKPRVNLGPRKCVNCNKSKTAYFRCHFWFMNGTKCGKIFCKDCLTTKFDVEDYDSIVSDTEWHCPSCLGRWARSTRSRRRK